MIADPRSKTAPALFPPKSPKLREARFEDYSQISALAAKFDLHTESYPAWTHLWQDNPVYRETQTKISIGWVLDSGENTISGYLGNIPVAYELGGKRLLAATTRAWVVDTPYRSYSPLLLATYFQQRNIDLFLSTTVNSQSEAAYTSFKSSRVPVGAWDRTLFWITNYRGFMASYLRKGSSRMVKPLRTPLSLGLFLRDRVMGSRLPKNGNLVSVLPCASFDERFQGFWDALRKAKWNVLLADRSRESLEWHFKFALLQNMAWIFIAEGSGGLVAYSVFLRHDYPQVGLTRMRLADFQCLEPTRSMDLLTAMLTAAADRCRQDSIHMLELVGVTPAMEARLSSASPHHRPLGSWLSFYKANSQAWAKVLDNPSVWEPSLFDGDSSL